MKRFFISLSFKGSNFQGWQMQPGKSTVQGELDKALEILLGEKTGLTGAGRTDSGVHAINYIAHFDSNKLENKNIPGLIFRLNRIIPHDITIHHIEAVKETSHARFDAISRTYHYLVSLSKNPFLQDYSLYLPKKPDLEAMNKTCKILLEYKDFESFSKLHGNNKTFICDLQFAEWKQINSELLVFRITSDRFLRNMVRAIAGTLLNIGAGKLPPQAIREIIEKKDRGAAGHSVKAKGLFLTDIKYRDIHIPKSGSSLLSADYFI
ncbi:MAG: tRNA pseudouridine(38-40) synthase TruA [Bacteroidales bacterium]|nr:tRNA pseudouridine(38-40) synthase TruA [Bacteroidales bacterium]MCB9013624.1 tRNA pseudouridine(38-40) synthase TruA [Bacteroidales bacterium]